MRGTLLSKALQMLKVELGHSEKTGAALTSLDLELLGLIDNTQSLLADTYDWPFLTSRQDVAITAGIGEANRYYDLPTTLVLERPLVVTALWGDRWHPVSYGIGAEQYNSISSGDGGVTPTQSDPINRWQVRPDDDTQFEIWPLPANATTLRFEGTRRLTSLSVVESTGKVIYDLNAALDLDYLMIVYFVAADKLARSKNQDAPAKLQKAQQRLSIVRSAYPQENTVFRINGNGEQPRRQTIKIGVA